MFPLPVMIGLTLFVTLYVNKRLRKYSILIIIALGIIWFSRSFKTNSEVIIKNGLEVVCWNAGHIHGAIEAIDIIGTIPDILVIIECNEEKFVKAKQQYANSYFSKEQIGVFSKKPLTIVEEITSKGNSTILNFKVDKLNFFAIDVSPSIFNFRKDELEFLSSFLVFPKNSIVLGDFNTPYESKHLSVLKRDYNNAFSERGNGFRETWFWNIPLLSLDHIWVSKDLKILKTEKINTFKSDHSMIRAYIMQ